jgi:radical SAM superfamily enzyme YgiQ (UPF0313 family)
MSLPLPLLCQPFSFSRVRPERPGRNPVEEILYWHRKWGIADFAFYDDALLVSSKTHMGVLLEEIARLNLPIRFHTPNAIHVREITKSIAKLLRQTGFQTIRLGLEAADKANGGTWTTKYQKVILPAPWRTFKMPGFIPCRSALTS